MYVRDFLNRGKAMKDTNWVILAVVDERQRREKQKQTERLHSDVILHRNSTYDMIPFTVNFTEPHKETREEVAKALLVVLMMSGGISKDFIFIFTSYELFKMFMRRIYYMIIKTQDTFFFFMIEK